MKGISTFIITDILKNRIVLLYTLVLCGFSWSIFSLEDNVSKGILSMLNIILLIVPLVSIIFANIYMYNSTEFIELLVSQPVKRSSIWSSLFFGLTVALNAAFFIGIGIPVLVFITPITALVVILAGILLTTVFVSIAMLCFILMRDKAKGIGLSIMIWLFLSLMYDGLVLFFMFQYADYPIEKIMVLLSAINPVDLARIQVLLQIDVAALMGYTGAIFKKLFGTHLGYLTSLLLISFWILCPYFFSLRLFKKKDL
ncbi:MAG: ABC transporter permease [Saprospiraceae bacterium]|nr:ABC transporter permease [Saprospiraceae bacterium]MBK8371266.1 ABC transporter permease [Saprospiraceae bacterium]MBK8545879.1 ABC transporter permease [Saprospiraceae bacterium]MBK8819656.1 ABC transporter permease [Saprospiraceae bacterium]MBK8853871.1 ABC transporter permease [Saprospiraceae bacterium]